MMPEEWIERVEGEVEKARKDGRQKWQSIRSCR